MKKQITEYKKQKYSLGSEKGFTITELMVALVITAIAMAAVYSTFIVQQRSFIVQDQVAETQASSKIAFNMLLNDIMNAGFGIPENPNINNVTEIVTIANNAGNVGTIDNDTITLISGFFHIADVGLPASDIALGKTTVDVGQRDITNRSYLDICYTGTTIFNDTDKKYLSIDGVTYAEIEFGGVQAGSVDCNFNGINQTGATVVARLILDRDIDKSFPVEINKRPTPVYLIEDVTYSINAANSLERQGRIGMPQATITIADNIEDLQIEEIDQPVAGITDGITDRLRVNLLARTAREDQTLDSASKPYVAGITLEDGTIKGFPADQFRRRIWSMEVKLRNPEM